MPWLAQVKGVLEMWYPGEQDGNAAAALLYGDVNPSGKLPFTFPTSMAQTPLRSAQQYPGVNDAHGVPRSTYSEGLLVGYRWYDANHLTPLFPFGFGLSYSTFAYANLKVTPSANGATVRVDVTNTGRRPGAEVTQVYLSSPAAAHEPPKQLKGYDKVLLQPGETRTITIALDERAFSYWNTATHAWRVAPGCYTVRAGGSSADLPLSATVARGGADCSAVPK
jgi:beta-glucosidase